MAMAVSEDTEITLGTGKILGLFFGLVVLCAVFFSMGFSVGRNSAKAPVDNSTVAPATGKSGTKPTSTASAASDGPSKPEMTFYKSVGENSAGSELAAKTAPPPDAKNAPVPAAANVPPPLNGYYVQVAAVSKQEDADALIEALQKKQYSAVAAQVASDKLFHVQVGPFADIKEAEAMRTQLLGDGYNPILKR